MNAFKNQNMLFIRTNSYENYGKESISTIYILLFKSSRNVNTVIKIPQLHI